jgi:hypothetical protein
MARRQSFSPTLEREGLQIFLGGGFYPPHELVVGVFLEATRVASSFYVSFVVLYSKPIDIV